MFTVRTIADGANYFDPRDFDSEILAEAFYGSTLDRIRREDPADVEITVDLISGDDVIMSHTFPVASGSYEEPKRREGDTDSVHEARTAGHRAGWTHANFTNAYGETSDTENPYTGREGWAWADAYEEGKEAYEEGNRED